MLFRTASPAKPKKAEAVRRSAKNFERPTPTEPLALLGGLQSPVGLWFKEVSPLTDKSNLKHFFKVFWEEEEKTIEYRFFDDVTKTRRVSRRVYRADDTILCFRKGEDFFSKKSFA